MSFPGGLTDEDYTILKFIADREMVVDPKTVAANVDVDRGVVKNRLPKLREQGFLKRPEQVPDGLSPRGLYEATELGYAYAEGDKTIAELRELLREHGENGNND